MSIYSFEDIAKRQSNGALEMADVDFCIVGSGGAGAVVAYELSRTGKKVIVLEKGKHYLSASFNQREFEMTARLTSDRVVRPATGKHTRMPLVMAECLGGSPVLADATCFDPPAHALREWAGLGLTSFSPERDEIHAYVESVKQMQNITRVQECAVNKNNQLFRLACERSGYYGETIERNIREGDCHRCGFCAQGCRYEDKRSGLVTYIPLAVDNGVDFFTEVGVEQIDVDERNGGYIVHAHAEPRALEQPPGTPPISVTVRARCLILAAGAVGTPQLLLHSPSKFNLYGLVGKNFRVHYHTFTLAAFEGKIIDSFEGIPGTFECLHFSDLRRDAPDYDPRRFGFWYESTFAHPWGLAMTFNMYGDALVDLMEDYRHLAAAILHANATSVGRVTARGVQFDINDFDNRRLVLGTKLAAALWFKAGADRVYTSMTTKILRRPEDIRWLDDGPQYQSPHASVYSAHLMGGCVMGVDPARSVVNEHGEFHGHPRLFVCDASVFPTTLGIHPYVTVLTIGKKTAEFIKRQYA